MNKTKIISFILAIAEIISCAIIPVSASDSYTIENGSICGSGAYTDTTHASTVVQFDSGDLMSAWFGGSGEGDDDVRIWYSIYSDGHWCGAKQVPSSDTVAHWNPVLQNFGEYVRLYYKVGTDTKNWVTKYTDTYDEGATWTVAQELVPGDETGGRGPVKNKCLVKKDGVIIAPASTEQGDWASFFDISEDGGKTWKKTALIESNTEMIQPTLWEDEDGNVHAFFRTKAGKIYRSDSEDGGYTWCKAYKTELPNNNSGLDVVMTDNGWLWLAYNPISVNGLRYKLRLSVSKDNGETWEKVTEIESSVFIFNEFSYPSIIEDGNHIYLTYTYKRNKIKYLFVEF